MCDSNGAQSDQMSTPLTTIAPMIVDQSPPTIYYIVLKKYVSMQIKWILVLMMLNAALTIEFVHLVIIVTFAVFHSTKFCWKEKIKLDKNFLFYFKTYVNVSERRNCLSSFDNNLELLKSLEFPLVIVLKSIFLKKNFINFNFLKTFFFQTHYHRCQHDLIHQYHQWLDPMQQGLELAHVELENKLKNKKFEQQ